MRILIISNSYLPALGGLQTAVHTLAQLFQQKAEVQVITNRYPRTAKAIEKIEGIPVDRYPFLPFSTDYLSSGRIDLFLASALLHPTSLIRLYAFMRKFRPDVVNVHFPQHQVPFVLFLRRFFSFRLVVSLHGDEILKWFDENRQRASTRDRRHVGEALFSILQEADAVTACSRYLLDRATELVPSIAEKGYVIHNGVDVTRFEGKKISCHARAYCLAYGRLTRKKGFDLLIRAFGVIAQNYPDMDLTLAGEGEERQVLEELVAELDLTSRVIFFGRASPGQVAELLLGCRFVAIPSRTEPFGIVALESMAAGKPIVATCVGGLSEILAGTANRLVEPTVEGLAAGLDWMIHHSHGTSFIEENRELAARYSWQKASERYFDVFQKDTGLSW